MINNNINFLNHQEINTVTGEWNHRKTRNDCIGCYDNPYNKNLLPFYSDSNRYNSKSTESPLKIKF